MSYYPPEQQSPPHRPQPDLYSSAFGTQQQQSITHPWQQNLQPQQGQSEFAPQLIENLVLSGTGSFVPPQATNARCRLENIFTKIHALLDEVQSIFLDPALAESNEFGNRYGQVIQKASTLISQCAQQRVLQLAACSKTANLSLESTMFIDDLWQYTQSFDAIQNSITRASSSSSYTDHIAPIHGPDQRALLSQAQALPSVVTSQQIPATLQPLQIRNESINGGEGTNEDERGDMATRSEDTSGSKPHASRPRSNLLKKLRDIGNSETMAAAEEFIIQLQNSNYQASHLPGFKYEPYGLEFVTYNHNSDELLRMLPKLATVIECSIFGEREQKIRKRIALAHFYYAYTQAQQHPKVFFSRCKAQLGSSTPMLYKSSQKSAVQQRFADLVFPQTTARGRSMRFEKDSIATRVNKIQTWRKYGKGWAKLITRFGYAILLFVPPSLTDEDLRSASDQDIDAAIELVESQPHSFTEALQHANEILSGQLFKSPENLAFVEKNV